MILVQVSNYLHFSLSYHLQSSFLLRHFLYFVFALPTGVSIR